MKALVQNYTTSTSTEAAYLHESLNCLNGVESAFWSDTNVSVFDMFDIVKPDIFITHITLLNDDALKYLRRNQRIKLIVNVTGSSQETVDLINHVVKETKINCPLLFTNQPKRLNRLSSKGTKLISVMHGADLFAGRRGRRFPEYQIELGLLTDYKSDDRLDELLSSAETYHYLTQNPQPLEGSDIHMSAFDMYELYGKYNKFVVSVEDLYIPQAFFDATIYGNKTYYHCKYDAQTDRMKDVLDGVLKVGRFVCGTQKEIAEDDSNFDRVKDTVLEKHTCLNRLARIFSNIKMPDLESQTKQLIGNISK